MISLDGFSGIYLDFAGRDRGALVVVSQTRGLGGDALEDVVHERVHDGHGLRGDTGVGVHLKSVDRLVFEIQDSNLETNLLEDTVDVDGVGLLSLVSALLVAGAGGFLGLGGLLGSLGGRLGRHCRLFTK